MTLLVSYIVELHYLLVQLYHTVIIQAYHFMLKVSMGFFVYMKLTNMTQCISFLIDIIIHTRVFGKRVLCYTIVFSRFSLIYLLTNE